MSLSSIFPHARVAPASLQTIIREAHISLTLQKKIDTLTRRLYEQLKKLEYLLNSPGRSAQDIYETEHLAKKTEVDIATTKAHAMQVRPFWLSHEEVAMITHTSLLHLSKDDIALIPELVDRDDWDIIQGMLLKNEH